MSETAVVPVTGARGYPVAIGEDLLDVWLPKLVSGARTVALFHQPTVRAAARRIASELAQRGHPVAPFELPDGEAAKDLRHAADAWEHLARAGVTRSDAVVAVGGGAATDLAGFVAATWLRGVAVVHVPTTLLGMVDAALGGKTGINTAAGKNLVGAFHPPAGVICDLALLAGLPEAELASGAAEIAKCGFIADPAILDLLEPGWAADPARLAELVRRAVTVKARVVSADLEEAGPREMLNYGHTLGHAIERHEDFRIRHGEAVSVGLVYAAELSRRVLGLSPAVAARHAEVLARLGLPTRYDVDAWPALRRLMAADKKSRGATLRLVLLHDLARPATVAAPAEDVLEGAYRKVCEA